MKYLETHQKTLALTLENGKKKYSLHNPWMVKESCRLWSIVPTLEAFSAETLKKIKEWNLFFKLIRSELLVHFEFHKNPNTSKLGINQSFHLEFWEISWTSRILFRNMLYWKPLRISYNCKKWLFVQLKSNEFATHWFINKKSAQLLAENWKVTEILFWYLETKCAVVTKQV